MIIYVKYVCASVGCTFMYIMTDIHLLCAHYIVLYRLLCTDELRFDMLHHLLLYCTEVYCMSLVPQFFYSYSY